MIKGAKKIDYDIRSAPMSCDETTRLSEMITDYKKSKEVCTPENIDGACLTGKIMDDKEVKEISRFIAQYKDNKRRSTISPKKYLNRVVVDTF